jgi:hypothetical protein
MLGQPYQRSLAGFGKTVHFPWSKLTPSPRVAKANFDQVEVVMAGHGPATHALAGVKTWMRGTSPRMTVMTEFNAIEKCATAAARP